jgi:hypothetical protein
VTELVSCLVAWVVAFAHAPQPAGLPRVELVSHARLETMVCGEPCPVQGAYGYGDVVYLDDALDPMRDLWARSVLVHEIVHYLQESSGRYERATRQHAIGPREHQAYAIQLAYLQRRGGPPRPGAPLPEACSALPPAAAAPHTAGRSGAAGGVRVP